MQGSRVSRRLGLLSISNSKRKRHPISIVNSITLCLKRRQDYPSKFICCITLKYVLASVPTRITSGTEWEDPQEAGPRLWNSKKIANISEITIWRLLRSKTICFIALPRNPAHTVKLRRSRISIPEITMILSATLPDNNCITNTTYPAIVTEINIDRFL